MLITLLKRHLRPYTWSLVGVVALQLIASMAALFLPNLNARIIDDGVTRGDIDVIWRFGFIMLAVSLAQITAQAVAVFLAARTAMRFGRDVRHGVFSHVLSFSSQEVNRFGAPSLITRNTNDVQQVQQLVMMSSTLLVSAPIMMVGGIIMAVREDPGMSPIVAVAMLVLGSIIALIARRMTPLFKLNQTRLDTLNRVLREQITGIRVIRAFTREPEERARFAAANDDIRDVNVRIGSLFSLMFPVVMLITNVSSVAVMWFGGQRVEADQIMVGQLIAFLTYLMQILMSVMMATMMMLLVPRASVCAVRIMEVLNTPSSVVTSAAPVTSSRGPGVVRFDDVSFAYPGAEEPVLKNVTFEMRPGTTTAIIGSTGSGKTTLVNLIPRLYDATSGVVSIDGIDVRDIEPNALWARIGLVPQQPYLVSGTVASHLRYGNPDATDEQMWDALTAAQAADFVSEMDGELEAKIAQGGTNVSGGQRQRLSIARSLIRDPDVCVFDDAFSALDVATDARLRAVLEARTADATSLIVAQRVSSIRHADQIIVLDAGEIVGVGTHAELLATNETYREIVDSQLSAEEAA